MNRYKAVKINGVKKDEHRILSEQKIGRKLERHEVVHHINGDPRDNRIENLEVMTLSDHAKLHHTGRRQEEWIRKARSERMKGQPNLSVRALSEDDVRYIRENYVAGDKEFGVRALARKFNIKHSTISKIVNNKTYINF